MKVSPNAIDRCLDVIELLADEPGGLSLTEIKDHFDLPKSAAHRLLSSLVARAYVRQDASHRYKLTMHLVQVGFGFLAKIGITSVCQSIIDDLADRLGELVSVFILDEDNLVPIARAQGARGHIVLDPFTRPRVPLHAAGSGKAWLSTLPDEKAVELVMRQGFGAPGEDGPNAIQTVQALLDELAETRRRGYGLNIEEAGLGLAAVGIVVRSPDDPDAPVLGTLSIAGPAFRMPRERLEGFVPEMKKAADELAALWPAMLQSLSKNEMAVRRMEVETE